MAGGLLGPWKFSYRLNSVPTDRRPKKLLPPTAQSALSRGGVIYLVC